MYHTTIAVPHLTKGWQWRKFKSFKVLGSSPTKNYNWNNEFKYKKHKTLKIYLSLLCSSCTYFTAWKFRSDFNAFSPTGSSLTVPRDDKIEGPISILSVLAIIGGRFARNHGDKIYIREEKFSYKTLFLSFWDRLEVLVYKTEEYWFGILGFSITNPNKLAFV